MYLNQKTDSDCIKVSIANLLKLEYSDVPCFIGYPNNCLVYLNVSSFLDKYNYNIIFFELLKVGSERELPVFFSENKIKCIGLFGKIGFYYTHAVLLEITNKFSCFSYKTIHDPCPGNDLTGCTLDQIMIFNKRS